MTFFESVKDKAKIIAISYALIFIPMWSLFVINNFLLSDALNSFGGIHPRDFSFFGILEIFTSWMFHSSGNPKDLNNHIYSHILGNSEALFGLLLIVGLIEKRPVVLLTSLIAASGFATWLIGSGNSVHVGASGLIFAIFGYVFSSIFLAKRWLYLIPSTLIGGSYLYSIQAGLMPQNGVSFAAHFGGLVGGIFVAFLIGKYNSLKESSSQNITSNKTEIFKRKIRNFFRKK